MSLATNAPDELATALIEQADRVFEGETTSERIRSAEAGVFQRELWTAIEDAGLPLALVPERLDGIGMSWPAAMRLIRRSAYWATPAPVGETIVANALWAEASGQVPSGPASLAPSFIDAVRRDGRLVLSGELCVPWGTDVEHILALAVGQSGERHLTLLPGSMTVGERSTNLAGEPRLDFGIDGVEALPAFFRPSPWPNDDALTLAGALLRANQMTGAMERALEHAVSYAGERRQFGRPIGKFQAVQQSLAEAAGHVAASQAASDLGAEAYGTSDFGFYVAAAKARVGEAAGKVAEICHQVHGAMGFTQEHPLHFSTRRLWSWRDEFGNETFWQERLGRAVCEGGGDALWQRVSRA